MHRRIAQLAIAASAIVASTHAAVAAGSGMPWEAPLQRILESIEGPVAKVIAVVIIIIDGPEPLLRRHGRRPSGA